jgi:hypothetical protein
MVFGYVPLVLAEPLYAQVGTCDAIGDFDGATESLGELPGSQWLAIRFAYAVPSGTNVDVDGAVSAAHTVEVCRVRQVGLGPVVLCPWSQHVEFGKDWLVWNATEKPESDQTRRLFNGVSSDTVEPLAVRVGESGTGTPLQTFHLRFDWRDPANAGMVFVLRVRSDEDADGVEDGDDAMPYDGPEFAEIAARDGFCPAPAPIAEWPSTDGAHFRAFAPSLQQFVGPNDPIAQLGLGLGACANGSKVLSGLLNGSACVDDRMALWSLQQLQSLHEWQRDHLSAGDELTPPTWQQGTAAACNGSCPAHVFFHPTDAGTAGGWGTASGGTSISGAMLLPPDGEWGGVFMPAVELRTQRMGHPLAVLGHEFFHAFQEGWVREKGSEPIAFADYILGEGLTAAVGPRVCIKGYDSVLPPNLCVSPTRLKPMKDQDAKHFLEEPTQGMFQNKYAGASFWNYALEQFAVSKQYAPAAHPGGAESDFSWQPGVPLGKAYGPSGAQTYRGPDEGMDLIRFLLDAIALPENTNLPIYDALNAGLVATLGRGLEPMVFDAQTAYVLKDYADQPDVASNPVWHLEWLGNPNVDQPLLLPQNAAMFPDQPPPDNHSLDKSKWDIGHAKAVNNGRLFVPGNLLEVSDFDYLPRACRGSTPDASPVASSPRPTAGGGSAPMALHMR